MLDSKGFDLWADGYDASVKNSDEENSYPFAGYKNVLGCIFGSVMHKPGASVLDLGFGTGTLTAKLYERGMRIFGQDFSPRMTELASAKMPGAMLFQGDLNEGLAEPLLKERYDFIIAAYSLHHLDEKCRRSLIITLLGLLKEGGEILIGDVAFETREQLSACRAIAGEEWDEDEFYFVIDELREVFPKLEFQKVSFCSGVIKIE